MPLSLLNHSALALIAQRTMGWRAHTHSTATERGLDKKIAAHEDQARSQTQGKVTRSTDSTAS